jgi:hypothetical protein
MLSNHEILSKFLICPKKGHQKSYPECAMNCPDREGCATFNEALCKDGISREAVETAYKKKKSQKVSTDQFVLPGTDIHEGHQQIGRLLPSCSGEHPVINETTEEKVKKKSSRKRREKGHAHHDTSVTSMVPEESQNRVSASSASESEDIDTTENVDSSCDMSREPMNNVGQLTSEPDPAVEQIRTVSMDLAAQTTDINQNADETAQIPQDLGKVMTNPTGYMTGGNVGSQKLFCLRDIEPNPFRDMERYPVQRDKIDALKESITTTGFWSNLIARERNGKAQIAYGHHRLMALREIFSPETPVLLNIRDLDDSQMIWIMVRENMDEWKATMSVTQETVRSVIEAYGQGILKLPDVPKTTQQGTIRYAPSFQTGGDDQKFSDHPYTVGTLTKFLGWDESNSAAAHKIRIALDALALMENGILNNNDLDGLNASQTSAIIKEVEKVGTGRKNILDIIDKNIEEVTATLEEAAEKVKTAKNKRKREDAEQVYQAALQLKKEKEEENEEYLREIRLDSSAVGRHLCMKLREGNISVKQVTAEALRIISAGRTKKNPPSQEEIVSKLVRGLSIVLDDEKDPKTQVIRELARQKEFLSESAKEKLIETLNLIVQKVNKMKELFY